jgi:hypothetical protein
LLKVLPFLMYHCNSLTPPWTILGHFGKRSLY